MNRYKSGVSPNKTGYYWYIVKNAKPTIVFFSSGIVFLPMVNSEFSWVEAPFGMLCGPIEPPLKQIKVRANCKDQGVKHVEYTQ